jgi:hypothetical protein
VQHEATLVRVFPERSGYEQCLYECPKCEHEGIEVGQFKKTALVGTKEKAAAYRPRRSGSLPIVELAAGKAPTIGAFVTGIWEIHRLTMSFVVTATHGPR